MRPGAFDAYLLAIQMPDFVPHALRSSILRRAGVTIGDRAYLKAGLRVGSPRNLVIGDRVFIAFDVYMDATASITIGSDVDIADHVRLVTSTHAIGAPSKRAGDRELLPIRIGSGVWIGSGVTVLPGVTVGSGCVLAAGAVVTKDCAADGIYAGVPAKRIRDLESNESGAEPRATSAA